MYVSSCVFFPADYTAIERIYAEVYTRQIQRKWLAGYSFNIIGETQSKIKAVFQSDEEIWGPWTQSVLNLTTFHVYRDSSDHFI